MNAHNRVRGTLAIGTVILMALVLSACLQFPPADPAGDPYGNGESVDPGPGDSSTLPENFPGDIPLFNNDIAFASYAEAEASWTVLLMTQDLNADFNSACNQLAEAGFANTFYQQQGTDSLATFDGTAYRIQLVGREDVEHGPVLDYFVMSLQ